MSEVKKQLDQKYARLCAELGDLLLKQEQITLRVSAIKTEIKQLNDSASSLIAAEAKKAQEASSGQETTQEST